MFHEPLFLLVMGFAALQLAFWGTVIRIKGPEGFVHGMGDLRRLDVDQRSAIGRRVGNALFAMALLIAAFGVFCCFYANDALAMFAAGAALVAAIVTIVLSMKRHVSRLTQIANEATREY